MTWVDDMTWDGKMVFGDIDEMWWWDMMINWWWNKRCCGIWDDIWHHMIIGWCMIYINERCCGSEKSFIF